MFKIGIIIQLAGESMIYYNDCIKIKIVPKENVIFKTITLLILLKFYTGEEKLLTFVSNNMAHDADQCDLKVPSNSNHSVI